MLFPVPSIVNLVVIAGRGEAGVKTAVLVVNTATPAVPAAIQVIAANTDVAITEAANAIDAAQRHGTIGTSPTRPDGIAKVQGSVWGGAFDLGIGRLNGRFLHTRLKRRAGRSDQNIHRIELLLPLIKMYRATTEHLRE